MYLKEEHGSATPSSHLPNSQFLKTSVGSSTYTTMRISFYSSVFLTLLLIFAYFSASSIQDMDASRDQGKARLDQVPNEGTDSASQTRTNELINEIMGMEVCHSKDEECLARRLIAEAHLDYIYTQHHKP